MRNVVILAGRLGKDPEVKVWDDSTATARVSLATSSYYKKKGEEEFTEEVQWHMVIFRGGLVEKIKKARKGSPILVTGTLKYRKYNDKDGVERLVAEIYAGTLDLFESSGGAGSPPMPGPSEDLPSKGSVSSPNEDDFDDLPF